MNILHISTYPEQWLTYTKKSGVASYLKKLLTSKKSSYQMTVLCEEDQGYQRYKEDNLTIIRWRKRWLSAIIDIVNHLRKHRYNVIHIQHELHFRWSTIVGYMVLLLPVLFGRKKTTWIITSHHAIDYSTINQEFVKNHGQKIPVWLVKTWFRVLYRLYHSRDQIIVHEDIHRSRLINYYGLDAHTIQVIHHGVDQTPNVDSSLAKQTLWISPKTKVIFTMWYVTWYKDLSVLIQWYAHRLSNNPDSILIIWSWPEKKSLNNHEYMDYYQSLQDMARDLIPADKYKRLWFIDQEDIATYYGASDVVVLPYRYTLSASGPMAIAIAYEKPFLASRCFQDYFVDFSDCIFDMDSISLSDKLTHFFTHLSDYTQFVIKLKKERSYKKCLENTEKLYQNNVLWQERYSIYVDENLKDDEKI